LLEAAVAAVNEVDHEADHQPDDEALQRDDLQIFDEKEGRQRP